MQVVATGFPDGGESEISEIIWGLLFYDVVFAFVCSVTQEIRETTRSEAKERGRRTMNKQMN